jgi:DNA polymerase IIIc chi subunit
METITEFCKRTGKSNQRVLIWIKEKRLKAKLINHRWELEDNQEVPEKLKRGKATKQLNLLGKVRQYTKDGEFVAEYLNLVKASEALKTSTANLCAALNKPNRSAMGYRWKRNDLSQFI